MASTYQKVKTPFNYAGNKFRFLDIIIDLMQRVKYDCCFDLFAGSNNIVLNADPNSFLISNDIIPVVQNVFANYSAYNIDKFEKLLSDRLEEYQFFMSKAQYYKFRQFYNKNYINDKKWSSTCAYVDTLLLLKMCSNSMLRFNRDGFFNQGFRGYGKGLKKGTFWANKTIESLITKVEEFDLHITKYLDTTLFLNCDFMSVTNSFDLSSSNIGTMLYIADPPYLHENFCYQSYTYSPYSEKYLLNILREADSNGNYFIYFNYLKNDTLLGTFYREDIISNFISREIYYKVLRKKSYSGQKRARTKAVVDCIFTNIKANGFKHVSEYVSDI